MAMEDAVRLSYEIEACSNQIERAFANYQKARTERTAKVQLGSRRMGEEIFHPAGSLAEARNRFLKELSSTDYLDAASWLYSGSGLP